MSFKSFADKLRNKLLNCLYQLIASLKGRNNLLSNKDLKNLKNDFEPSMWSQFVRCVHKLLRNLCSFLNIKGIWFLIALFLCFDFY